MFMSVDPHILNEREELWILKLITRAHNGINKKLRGKILRENIKSII